MNYSAWQTQQLDPVICLNQRIMCVSTAWYPGRGIVIERDLTPEEIEQGTRDAEKKRKERERVKGKRK